MNIEELIKCFHKIFEIKIINPNSKSTNKNIVIRFPNSKIIDIINTQNIQLNDFQNNIRFSLSEDSNLLDHIIHDGYIYLRLNKISANENLSLYLHILPKSYTYLGDDSIFLYKSNSDDFIIEESEYYDITDLSIKYLQEDENDIVGFRNQENKTINQEHGNEYYTKKDKYIKESNYVYEETIDDISNSILNTTEDTILIAGVGQFYMNGESGTTFWSPNFNLDRFNLETTNPNYSTKLLTDSMIILIPSGQTLSQNYDFQITGLTGSRIVSKIEISYHKYDSTVLHNKVCLVNGTTELINVKPSEKSDGNYLISKTIDELGLPEGLTFTALNNYKLRLRFSRVLSQTEWVDYLENLTIKVYYAPLNSELKYPLTIEKTSTNQNIVSFKKGTLGFGTLSDSNIIDKILQYRYFQLYTGSLMPETHLESRVLKLKQTIPHELNLKGKLNFDVLIGGA